MAATTIIEDRILIDCAPDQIRNLIVHYFQSTENYRTWHKEHVSCYWKKGKDFAVGSILVAKEYLNGGLYTLGFRIIENDEKRMAYAMLPPFSVVCAGGSFEFMGKQKGTELIARLEFRCAVLLKTILKKTLQGIARHMAEEGTAIRSVLEKK